MKVVLTVFLSAIIQQTIAQFWSGRKSGPFHFELDALETGLLNNEVCKVHFELGRISRSEKVISGYMDLSKDIGPLAGEFISYEYVGSDWKDSNRKYKYQDLCIVRKALDPFFRCLTTDLTPHCTIRKGKHILTNYTMEETFRSIAGNNFPYGKFKLVFLLSERNHQRPVCGWNVTYLTENAEKHDHQTKVTQSQKSRKKG